MANPVNGEWEGSSFEAAFDRLFPQLHAVPEDKNGVPVLRLSDPVANEYPYMSDPYAAMQAAYMMGQTP